ncbi:MAG: 4Fe-4S binding protein [Spirochaetes bacterium]|nr:4Fe-4S binding protein [Spirochaetota bacterium]
MSLSRRDLLKKLFLWATGGTVAGLILGPWFNRIAFKRRLWQIDPDKCTNCGLCENACVKFHSAVRCVHTYAICGYCDLCSGYYRQGTAMLDTAPERQICPTGAIERNFIENPYFEYRINRELCIGCGRCAKNCEAFGNGSLYLQIDQEYCSHCNQCAIAAVCPANAIRPTEASLPYLLKGG